MRKFYTCKYFLEILGIIGRHSIKAQDGRGTYPPIYQLIIEISRVKRECSFIQLTQEQRLRRHYYQAPAEPRRCNAAPFRARKAQSGCHEGSISLFRARKARLGVTRAQKNSSGHGKPVWVSRGHQKSLSGTESPSGCHKGTENVLVTPNRPDGARNDIQHPGR